MWVAVLVAGVAQRRSEKIAAHVVISSLSDFLGTAKMWLAAWEQEPGKENVKRVFWLADRVLYGWPFVASDLDSARATLMDVDWEIGGRLDVFQKAYRSMSDARAQINELSRTGKFSQNSGTSERYCTLIVLGLESGAREAEAVMPLIERLVLSKNWRLKRFLRRLELLRRSKSKG